MGIVQNRTQELEVKGRLGVLSYDPSGLSFDEWHSDGKLLIGYHNSLQFAIGDWLLYGETRFCDEFENVVDQLGFSEGTLNNFKSVAKGLPPSRRRENVPYSIHSEVRSLEPEAAQKFLELAANEASLPEAQKQVTVKAIRDFKSERRGKEPYDFVTIHRLEHERLQAIARAAKHLLDTGESADLETMLAEYQGRYGEL